MALYNCNKYFKLWDKWSFINNVKTYNYLSID